MTDHQREPLSLLYLSHVDWAWIKQRPQFLAEALTQAGVAVDVRYLPAWRRGVRVSTDSTLRARRLPHLPPLWSYIRWSINPALRRAWLRLRKKIPTVVWVTHPSLFSSVPRAWRNRVVYDAMDLNAQFPGVDAARVTQLERELAASAVTVFASSQAIATHVRELGRKQEVVLVRNALDAERPWPALRPSAEPVTLSERAPRFMYVGTISTWLDFAALENLKEEWPDATISLVGPIDRAVAAQVRGLGVEANGPVAHSTLIETMSRADVLLMPFQLSSLVLGVDPVKLYEYVAMLKPVVATWYPELAHFRGLINFYGKSASVVTATRRALSHPLDTVAVQNFLACNTWRVRAEQAIGVLNV